MDKINKLSFRKVYEEMKAVKSSLKESQAQEIGMTYRKLSDYYGVDLNELVYGPNGFMKTKYPHGFDVAADIIFLEDKWNEFEAWLKETRGIDFEAIRDKKLEDGDDYEPQLTTDRMAAGQWYESLEEELKEGKGYNDYMISGCWINDLDKETLEEIIKYPDDASDILSDLCIMWDGGNNLERLESRIQKEFNKEKNPLAYAYLVEFSSREDWETTKDYINPKLVELCKKRLETLSALEEELDEKLDESQFQISRGSREFDNVIKTYYKKYGKHLQVDTMIYDKDRGKYYMYNDQTDYTLNTKRLDEELEESTITEVAGGMSKGLSVEDIAAKHGVSVEDIESQIKLGVKVEQEHTSDVEEAKKIAMDHLVEFPDYYDRLVKMEKEAEAELDKVTDESESLEEDLVEPKPDESESDYVSRFMGTKLAQKEFPNEKQRLAVAYSKFMAKKEALTEEVLDITKLNFHNLLGKITLEYPYLVVINRFDEENTVGCNLEVDVSEDDVINFICNENILDKKLLTNKEAQPLIDQVAADPKMFKDQLSDLYYEKAKEKAQREISGDYVEGFEPDTFDDDEHDEPVVEALQPSDTVVGVTVQMLDYDYDLKKDKYYAFAALSRKDRPDQHIWIVLNYSNYRENATYEWEEDGESTYVPYGDQEVLYDDGKGTVEHVTISEMEPDSLHYELQDDTVIRRDDAMEILEVTDEEMKKIEALAEKLGDKYLRPIVEELLKDHDEYYPSRDE